MAEDAKRTEAEIQAHKNALLDDIEGTVTEVSGFTNYSAKVTREGGQRFLDRLTARGWKWPERE